MPLTSSTKVTFPGGSLVEEATVIYCGKHPQDDTKILIITDITPFHPLDYQWPDQPADNGIIKLAHQNIPINHCLTAAFNQMTSELLLDQEIKMRRIKRNDSQWFFLVAHVVNNSDLPNNSYLTAEGTNALLQVDAAYRLSLSKSHTASHLAALALNKITKRFWQKPVDRLDSLGNPNLDSYAIVSSTINENCSRDQYHCGKTLRKLGFACENFFAAHQAKEIVCAINNQLVTWNFFGLNMLMTPPTSYLNEIREWSCVLPDGKAIIPCGGTHVAKTLPGEKVEVSMEQNGANDFLITSRLS